ncbi:MAG: NTP transferase domain-containing protein [Gammaproteobacteria bacterium]|nr:NTP transferase domain-containing protein [Gammaproteobacteria bacterium]
MLQTQTVQGIDMLPTGHAWAVVLAAGSGTRLAEMTTDESGRAIPKQYCSINGRTALLLDAIARAHAHVPLARILVVVDSSHAAFWRALDLGIPQSNVIVQPENRGTAIGVLLATLHIHRREPDAVAFFLPADHYVAQEHVLSTSVDEAIAKLASGGTDNLLLLGMTPDRADPELGYIVPSCAAQHGLQPIQRFCEKPAAPLAAQLIKAGARINTFIFGGRAAMILRLLARRAPMAYRYLRNSLSRVNWTPEAHPALHATYRNLSSIDLSRDILEGEESSLALVEVPACGWSDLGTPSRIADCLGITRDQPDVADVAARERAGPRQYLLDLASACRKYYRRPLATLA